MALRVSNVTKRFGDVIAVDDVSLDLGDAEILALVGPSGCGKSTLLRLIAGLLAVESGQIELAGEVVDDGRRPMPPEHRRVGLVFQEHALFPHLTVSGNVGFGVRTGDRDARVAEMLDVVGLTGYAHRFPHELSGGERQRVALARALAPRPALLLLDEPFASLDPNLRARVRDDVARILRETGTPAVFVTHDQLEALAIGDRVAVLRSGKLAQIDTPSAVFHTPTDRFVAAFMGEASFLRADSLAGEIDGVPAGALDGVPADALMMVRPDDVAFAVTESGTAVVTSAEFRGSEWQYRLRLPSGAMVAATRSHLDHAEVGAAVQVSLQPGHLPVRVNDDATSA